jgi:hypothetical protein
MKKYLTLLLLVSSVLTFTAFAQNQKLAQTGLKFLNVATDPRAVGMGEAVTSLDGGASSLFFNPASLAWMKNKLDAQLGTTQWIADIKQYYGSVAVTAPYDIGIFGFTFQSVDYGELDRTVVYPGSAAGYLDYGTFTPYAVSFGLGYARTLSDRFSIGGRIAYNIQDYGDGVKTIDANSNPISSSNHVEVMSYDFGMIYKTGLKSLAFASSIRNFSNDVKLERDNFQLPLTFRIGFSVNAMDFITDNTNADPLLLSIDAVNSRDYPETINIGGEYLFANTLALRAGYMFGYDEKGFTAGLGIQQTISGVGLGLDYAYTPFGVFGNLSRLAFKIYF